MKTGIGYYEAENADLIDQNQHIDIVYYLYMSIALRQHLTSAGRYQVQSPFQPSLITQVLLAPFHNQDQQYKLGLTLIVTSR